MTEALNQVASAIHASAPPGYKCADCTMDGEPCPTCYAAAWKKRHPHTVQIPPHVTAALIIEDYEAKAAEVVSVISSGEAKRCICPRTQGEAELWRDLCEKDDRTSPVEYPDMALITEDEFYSVLRQSASTARAEADKQEEDDVTPAAIAQLRDEADEILSKGKWTTISGADYEAKARRLIPSILFECHTELADELNASIADALRLAAADGKEAALKEMYERIGDAALASAFDAGAAEMRERCAQRAWQYADEHPAELETARNIAAAIRSVTHNDNTVALREALAIARSRLDPTAFNQDACAKIDAALSAEPASGEATADIVTKVADYLTKQFIWDRVEEMPKDECISEARHIIAMVAAPPPPPTQGEGEARKLHRMLSPRSCATETDCVDQMARCYCLDEIKMIDAALRQFASVARAKALEEAEGIARNRAIGIASQQFRLGFKYAQVSIADAIAAFRSSQ